METFSRALIHIGVLPYIFAFVAGTVANLSSLREGGAGQFLSKSFSLSLGIIVLVALMNMVLYQRAEGSFGITQSLSIAAAMSTISAIIGSIATLLLTKFDISMSIAAFVVVLIFLFLFYFLVIYVGGRIAGGV